MRQTPTLARYIGGGELLAPAIAEPADARTWPRKSSRLTLGLPNLESPLRQKPPRKVIKSACEQGEATLRRRRAERLGTWRENVGRRRAGRRGSACSSIRRELITIAATPLPSFATHLVPLNDVHLCISLNPRVSPGMTLVSH
jgi:hypothetical protein